MQAMATITETQSASYRTMSDVLNMIPRWPDPMSCCGSLLCTFENKDKCWEATNEVRKIYNDCLRSAIDEILDDTEDHLAQDARYRPFFCHSIYMVGRNQEKANPVIFFCCEEAKSRIKARDVVKASTIMKDYPAIRLGHTSFPPEFNAPPRFASGAEVALQSLEEIGGRVSSEPSIDTSHSPAWSFVSSSKDFGNPDTVDDGAPRTLSTTEIEEKQPSFSRIVFSYDDHRVSNMCGVQVVVEATEPPPEGIKMTLGGVILLDGKLYGLTAAHGLLEGENLQGMQGRLIRSVEYDRDCDDAEDSAVDNSSTEDISSNDNPARVKSLDSVKPLVIARDHPSGALARGAEPQYHNETDYKQVSNYDEGVTRVNPSREDSVMGAVHYTEGEVEGKEEQESSKVAASALPLANPKRSRWLGRIAFTSIVQGDLGLDWALIILEDRAFEALQCNKFSIPTTEHSGGPTQALNGIVESLHSRSPVCAVTARGAIPGTIFGTTLSMRLPGASKMCEVWAVQLHAPVEEGDCGSLVVNPSDGVVYGHIVARNIGTGFAYIIPAYRMKKEIHMKLGSGFTFATMEDYKAQSDRQENSSPGFKSSLTATTTGNSRRAASSSVSDERHSFASSSKPASSSASRARGPSEDTDPTSMMGPPAKKSRMNVPWTPAEEMKLKAMRDAGSTWAEIAKTFPSRTEGGVKKHWYKDMHYAEFAEDEAVALLNAIKEYENNKWKEIGKKVGKPAKACQQYAKEHFNKT